MSRTPSPLNLRAVALGYFTDMALTQLFGLALAIMAINQHPAAVRPVWPIVLTLLSWMGWESSGACSLPDWAVSWQDA